MLSRRNFLKVGLLGGIAAGTATMASGGGADLEIAQTPIAVPNLPKAFQNFRIGFITDLHMGTFLSPEVARDVATNLSNQKPDLVLLGGDLILNERSEVWRSLARANGNPLGSVSTRRLPDEAYRILADILSTLNAEHGTMAVFGNHDLWEGPKECELHLSAKGIQLLRNKQFVIQRGSAQLLIYGSDDYWTGFPNIANVTPRQPQQARILLSHNPDFVGSIYDSDTFDFDLALCGHTHGGQIRFPGMGAMFSNVKDRRFTCGLFGAPGRYVYTSRGIGYVEFPFRLNCPPELTIIELVKA